MNVILLIVGLALILVGANYLTDGSAALARRFKLSEFIVGLTVVAIGTSTPELVVSVVSALHGSGEMAIGNVTGSNLFNGLLILGVSTLIRPVPLTSDNIKKDIPLGILASIVLLVICCDVLLGSDLYNNIGRDEGIILLLLFVVFISYTVFSAKAPEDEEVVEVQKQTPMWLIIIMIVGGLAALVFGGNLFQTSAVEVARALGVSESVIAITLLAGGTSLPELAASVVSALKGKAEMAMGNVLGSNISNIFLVLGASATITPLSLGGITMVDLLTVLGASILLWITAFSFKRNKIDRPEAAILIIAYFVYIGYMISHQ
ncbi:MAG: calcium/sodium antiporter [Rikenellaceae bacterium]|nr:calcium/sodium antiporter [Rikenellaceae bacterium]MBR2420612.1 calcium/sodium antiporter [Rikenellaceae bacterium]